MSQTAPPKNVLFIAADDLNTDLGTYGHPLAQSPNLDRLASWGTRFDRAYCQSPFCGPSRASLLSGLRPDTTRVFDLKTNVLQTVPGAITLPAWFRRQGYYTARSGKIFHQGVTPTHLGVNGLDDTSAWDERVNPNWTARGRQGEGQNLTPRLGSGNAFNISESLGEDDDHPDGQTARFIVGKLQERARDKKPFFLAAGFYMPHVPLWAPKKYFAPYPLEKISLAPNGDRYGAPDLAYNYPAHHGMTPEQQKLARRAYLASTSFMDAQVGKILDALEQNGLRENTIVVFWSDHGFNLGQHGLWAKQNLFEDSARVPLIIADATGADGKKPGHQTGQSSASLVELLDLYPTLVELCGLPQPPQTLEGRSLKPLLKDPAARIKEAAFTQIGRYNDAGVTMMGRSVRTERFRYNEWRHTGESEDRTQTELYDLQSDPLQKLNLSGTAQSVVLAPHLKALLQESAPVPTPQESVAKISLDTVIR